MKVMERVQIHLKIFEEITGLKVNWEKSEVIFCNHTEEEQKEIRRKYNIQVKNSIKYLGINISNKIEDLKKLNYEKQKMEIKEMIKQYSKLSLSWFGRIALCKMKLLPKINFLFDVLPIQLKEKALADFQKILNNYCNGNKRPRIAKCLWYWPPKKGGLGLPNVRNYYRAFQLKNIIKILAKMKVIWEKIELKQIEQLGNAIFLDKVLKLKIR